MVTLRFTMKKQSSIVDCDGSGASLRALAASTGIQFGDLQAEAYRLRDKLGPDQKKGYDEAMKLLDTKHGAAYDAQYAALKGDALVAKNQPGDAKAAYKLALEKVDKQDAPFRDSVRMRMEALGG